jgi:dTMP kinase
MAVKNIFSLEGIDGSGKSTQHNLVRKHLKNSGIELATPTNPSHNILGEFIRTNVRELDPWLRNQLFILDIEHENRVIANDRTVDAVLWDRYIDSFYASNQEMTIAEAEELTAALDQPLRTFVLDVPVVVIMEDRKEVHDHHTIPDWLEMKRQRYVDLAEAYPARIEMIDGTIEKEAIAQHIAGVIMESL